MVLCVIKYPRKESENLNSEVVCVFWNLRLTKDILLSSPIRDKKRLKKMPYDFPW